MRPNTMRQVRRYHLYLGVFFAPAIFFFALSGALQTFRLQEEKGYGGTPPAWIVWMASVHKDSALPRVRPGAGSDEHAEEHAAERPKKVPESTRPAPPRPAAHYTLPMKIFAALLCVGLMLSAALGVAIALNSKQTRRMTFVMLIAGSLVPILLLQL